MKFHKGDFYKKLPPLHQVHTIYERDKKTQIYRTILMMDASGFFAMTKEKPLTGTPVYACVHEGHLFVYPVPDRTLEIRVRYTPPLKEV